MERIDERILCLPRHGRIACERCSHLNLRQCCHVQCYCFRYQNGTYGGSGAGKDNMFLTRHQWEYFLGVLGQSPRSALTFDTMAH